MTPSEETRGEKRVEEAEMPERLIEAVCVAAISQDDEVLRTAAQLLAGYRHRHPAAFSRDAEEKGLSAEMMKALEFATHIVENKSGMWRRDSNEALLARALLAATREGAGEREQLLAAAKLALAGQDLGTGRYPDVAFAGQPMYEVFLAICTACDLTRFVWEHVPGGIEMEDFAEWLSDLLAAEERGKKAGLAEGLTMAADKALDFICARPELRSSLGVELAGQIRALALTPTAQEKEKA